GCWTKASFAAVESTRKLSNARVPVPPLLAVRKPAYTAEAVPTVVRPVTVYVTGASTTTRAAVPLGPESRTQNGPGKPPQARSRVVNTSRNQSPVAIAPVAAVVLDATAPVPAPLPDWNSTRWSP